MCAAAARSLTATTLVAVTSRVASDRSWLANSVGTWPIAGPPAARSRAHANAQRSDAGWVTSGDRLHGRVVDRRRIVEMARAVIAIRRSTDGARAQTREPARVLVFSPEHARAVLRAQGHVAGWGTHGRAPWRWSAKPSGAAAGDRRIVMRATWLTAAVLAMRARACHAPGSFLACGGGAGRRPKVGVCGGGSPRRRRCLVGVG
jgi:hypothetical protein